METYKICPACNRLYGNDTYTCIWCRRMEDRIIDLEPYYETIEDWKRTQGLG